MYQRLKWLTFIVTSTFSISAIADESCPMGAVFDSESNGCFIENLNYTNNDIIEFASKFTANSGNFTNNGELHSREMVNLRNATTLNYGIVDAREFLTTGNIVNYGTLKSGRLEFSQFTNNGSLSAIAEGSNLVNSASGTITDMLYRGGETFTNYGSANVSLNLSGGGSPHIVNNGNMTLKAGHQAISDGVVSNTSAGTLNVTGRLVNLGTIQNEGNLEIVASGQITGDFRGNYYQNDGVTTVNGILNNNVFVNGGILKGTGIIRGDLVQTGGIIAPGNSPGTLTIDGDADISFTTLMLEIANKEIGNFDSINVTGNLKLSNTHIVYKFVQGYAPQEGDTYDLSLFSGQEITGLDSAIFSVAGLESGFDYSITNTGMLVANSDGIAVLAVPEPSISAMLLSGLGVLGWFSRRKMKIQTI